MFYLLYLLFLFISCFLYPKGHVVTCRVILMYCSPKHVFGHFFWHWYFYYYLIYSLIINIMAYTTTGWHDDTTTQIHDDMTTRQKPPPHGHTQGWRSNIETGGRLQRRQKKNGPNDNGHVIWALWWVFFFFFIHFYWY